MVSLIVMERSILLEALFIFMNTWLREEISAALGKHFLSVAVNSRVYNIMVW